MNSNPIKKPKPEKPVIPQPEKPERNPGPGEPSSPKIGRKTEDPLKEDEEDTDNDKED